MAETIKQVEAIPAGYPYIAPYQHTNRDHFSEDAAIDPSLIWQRIEAWIAYRWGERDVVWTVEGDGEWVPPLTPATLTNAEMWKGTEWMPVTLPEGPYGYCLPGDGPYRITATVGSMESPPVSVREAYQRLHEYSRGIAENCRDQSAFYEDREGGKRVVGHAAKSLQLSGAADLLRPYRRAQ